MDDSYYDFDEEEEDVEDGLMEEENFQSHSQEDDEALDEVTELIEVNREKEFSTAELEKNARLEDERLNELHIFRKESTLFVEDYDFYYRLCSFGSDDTPWSLQTSMFLCGPCPTGEYNFSNSANSANNTGTEASNIGGLSLSVREIIRNANSSEIADNVMAATLREHFTCCICLNLMFDPTTLPCGHSACLTCMKSALRNSQGRRNCPLCKTNLPSGLEFEVSVILRTTMQQLFPQEYGKSQTSLLELDVNSVLQGITNLFNVRVVGNGLSMSTTFEVLHDNNQVLQKHNLSAKPFAFRIWKDSNLMSTTMQQIRQSREMICSALAGTLAPAFLNLSTMPSQWYQLLTNSDMLTPNDMIEWREGYEKFKDVVKVQRAMKFNRCRDSHGPQSRIESENYEEFHRTMISPMSFNPSIPHVVVNQRYLSTTQMIQCFRRAGVLFEEYADDDNDDCIHQARHFCIQNCLIPLLHSIEAVAPTVVIGDCPFRSGYSCAKLCLVDDVLTANGLTRLPSENSIRHKEIYGFGYPGIPRCLLGHGLVHVLHQIEPDGKIDEVALSVIHDMVVSLIVRLVHNAKRVAKIVRLGHPLMDYRCDPNDEVKLCDYGFTKFERINWIETESATDGGSLQKAKEAWTSELYREVDFPDNDSPNGDDTMRSRLQHLSATNSLTKRVAIITFQNIQRIIPSCLCGQLEKHAQSEIIKALTKYKAVLHESELNIPLDGKTGRSSGLVMSPELVFSMLQHLPEYQAPDSLSMTIEAAIALACITEYIAAEILELSAKLAQGSVISPRNVMIAIKSDSELDSVFHGVIRNGGVLPNDPYVLITPDNFADESSMQQFREWLGNVESAMASRAFVHPLTGTISINDEDHPVSIPLYEMIAKITHPEPSFGSDPVRVDNVVRRKLQALESLPDELRAKFQELSKSPAVLWHIRREEVKAAQLDCMPIFDPESIASLCYLLYDQHIPSRGIFLQLSLEACELIGFLMERYIIEFMRRSLVASNCGIKGVVQKRDMKVVQFQNIVVEL